MKITIRPAARRGPRGLSVGDAMFAIEADAEVAIARRDERGRAILAYVRTPAGALRAYVEAGEAAVPAGLRALVAHAAFGDALPPRVASRLALTGWRPIALSPNATPEQRLALLRAGRASP